MSETPHLPESDDPFEVLGVGHATDAVELRRAYHRLIRIFRPDRHPQEFARVRAAYEEALESLTWWQAYDDDDDEDADEAASKSTAADPVWEAVRAAWTAVAAGEEASESLIGLRAFTDDARSTLHRFLVTEAAGRGHVDLIHSALQEGLPVAGWIDGVLSRAELGRLVTIPAFSWATLRRQPDEFAAAWLVRIRMHEYLLQRRLDDAVREVLDETFVEDASRLPSLQWVGREVLCAAAWAEADDLPLLERRYATDEVADYEFLSLEDHYAAAVALRPPWQRVRRALQRFKELRRFIVLAPILDAREMGGLIEDLCVDFMANATRYVACFDRILELSPELLERYILAVTDLPWPDGLPESDITMKHLHQLDAALRKRIRMYASTTDRDVYEVELRPQFFRLMKEFDLRPEALVEAIRERETDLTELPAHVEGLEGDRTLTALYWTQRLAYFEEDASEE